MTNISDVHSSVAGQTWNANRSANKASGTEASAMGSFPEGAAGDTVTISDSARALAEAYQNEAVQEQRLSLRFALGASDALVKGSEEEEKFKALIASVKSRKSDVMGRVESLLKDAGISLKNQGTLKLEVDSSGKIRAGGLDDAELTKKIEEALNKDKSLGRDMRDFQREEKQLSGQLKKYTGCSLYDLTMTAKGDVNSRIRENVEALYGDGLSDGYYTNLGFLDGLGADAMGLGDVQSLAFGGSIDFSGELGIVADPAETVKEKMEDLQKKIEDAFGAINNKLLAKLEEGGIEIDQEFRDTYLLDMKRAGISIDSRGGIEIEGMFCKDQRTHDKGEEVIRGLVRELLQDVDNSYHMNEFSEACERMISDMAEEAGLTEGEAFDARVVTEMRNGAVREPGVVSPAAEKRMVGEIADGVNALLENEGIGLSAPLEIEVDEDGKIRATNLEEVAEDAEAAQVFLDLLNARLKTAKPSEEEDSDPAAESVTEGGKPEEESPYMDLESGIEDLAERLSKLDILRRG